VDKRARNEDEQETKRQRLEKGDDEQLPIYAKKFSEEAIKAEGRRPKKKVAVLIGYSGTGYRGMQLSVSLTWSSRLTMSDDSNNVAGRTTRRPLKAIFSRLLSLLAQSPRRMRTTRRSRPSSDVQGLTRASMRLEMLSHSSLLWKIQTSLRK
jgi:hypothetical protein